MTTDTISNTQISWVAQRDTFIPWGMQWSSAQLEIEEALVLVSPEALFWRSRLIRVFPNCYSDNHFVTSSPGNQHFICKR